MAQLQGAFLPTTTIFNVAAITQSNLPDELQQLLLQMYYQVNNHALIINQKTHGDLSIQAYSNGCRVYPAVAGGEPRGVAFKAVDFGALPNAATKTVAHNITFNADTRIIRISCVSNNPAIPQAVPIPYADAGGVTGNIQLIITSANVAITTTTDWTAFTDTFVFIEYTT